MTTVLRPTIKADLVVVSADTTDSVQQNALIDDLEWLFDNKNKVHVLDATGDSTCVNAKPVRYDSGASKYTLAKGDSAANSQVIGFATNVTGTTTKNLDVVMMGELSGFTSLTPGSVYYLDQSTAGAITATKPSTGIVVRLGLAKSSTVMLIGVEGATQMESVIPSQVGLRAQTIEGSVANGNAVIWSSSNSRWEKCPVSSKPNGMYIGTNIVILFGNITGLSGLTPGSWYFSSNTTAGGISTNSASRCVVGFAISATQLLLDIDKNTSLDFEWWL